MLACTFAACGGCDDLGEPIHADCGNGVVDALEVCDDEALAGASCVSEGFEGGELACAPGCGGFVIAGCEGLRNPVDPCTLCAPWEGCVGSRCVSACEGEPFDEDTEQTFDVQTVELSGVVTVDGAPTDVEASLRVEGAVFWEPAMVPIASDGSYRVNLEPGAYQLTWVPADGVPVATESLTDLEVSADDPRQIRDIALTPWTEVSPIVTTDYPGDLGRVIVEHVDRRFGRIPMNVESPSALLLRDGEYRLWWAHLVAEFPSTEYLTTTTLEELRGGEIEIATIATEVRITMNGVPVPTDGEVRVELVRADAVPRPGWLSVSHDREAWALDADGRASGWMLDRPRDVAIVINGPPAWGWVWARRDVEISDEIEIDIAAPRVAGEVRRNGGRLPNGTLEGVARGRLEFASDEGFITVELTDRGRAEFDVQLPRALWELQVSGSVFSGALPIVPWTSPQAIAVEGDIDDLEVDVPAVRLAGQLTVNGLRPPDDLELETRGSLQLRQKGTNSWFSVPIPPRGPAGWDVIVAPGTYDAELVRWWFASTGEPAPPGTLPLGNWRLGELDVPIATRYDVDVRLHEVTASIEEDGASARRGLLWFEDAFSQRLAREIDVDGSPVTVNLYPGYYRVLWAPYDGDKAVDPIVLERTLVVDGPVDVTWDVGRIHLAGEITVNGVAANDVGEVEVQLTRQPYANATTSLPVAPTGPASFDAEVVAGHHTIVLGASSHETLPATGVVLHQACFDERL